MQDIKNTIVNITKNVTKSSGDLFKTTKLNISLATEEGNLKNLYTEIGKKVHEIYQYGGSLGKFFDEKYLEIEALERKISEIREQIGSIKGVRICSGCGKTIDRASGFCPKCGVRTEDARGVESGGAHFSDAHDAQYSQPAAEPMPPAYPPPPVEIPPAPPMPPMPPMPPPPIVKSCRVCNATNDPGTKFCASCGRLLD